MTTTQTQCEPNKAGRTKRRILTALIVLAAGAALVLFAIGVVCYPISFIEGDLWGHPKGLEARVSWGPWQPITKLPHLGVHEWGYDQYRQGRFESDLHEFTILQARNSTSLKKMYLPVRATYTTRWPRVFGCVFLILVATHVGIACVWRQPRPKPGSEESDC